MHSEYLTAIRNINFYHPRILALLMSVQALGRISLFLVEVETVALKKLRKLSKQKIFFLCERKKVENTFLTLLGYSLMHGHFRVLNLY